jgi:predicted transcriptional regulator
MIELIKKDYKAISKEIKPTIYYKLTDIAKNGWIYNDAISIKGRYEFIFKLVKRKEIKSKDVSFGLKPFYKIRGEEILKWAKNHC